MVRVSGNFGQQAAATVDDLYHGRQAQAQHISYVIATYIYVHDIFT